MTTRVGSGTIPPDQHRVYLDELAPKRKTRAEATAERQRIADEKKKTKRMIQASMERIEEFEAEALANEKAETNKAPAIADPDPESLVCNSKIAMFELVDD